MCFRCLSRDSCPGSPVSGRPKYNWCHASTLSFFFQLADCQPLLPPIPIRVASSSCGHVNIVFVGFPLPRRSPTLCLLSFKIQVALFSFFFPCAFLARFSLLSDTPPRLCANSALNTCCAVIPIGNRSSCLPPPLLRV